MEITTLQPNYDSRASFYGKAIVQTEGTTLKLYSYGTYVARIHEEVSVEVRATVFDTHSDTTLRHIKEFLKQYGFQAETAKQIMADYGVTK